jgi:hypothetical protein
VSNFTASRSGAPGQFSSATKADRSGLIARLALAVVAGFAAGAVTEGLVLRVSFSLVPLTNSAAPWVLVAFAVALTGRDVREAVALAIVAFLALVLGFYVAQATRGWAVSHHQVAFWFVASLVAGPCVGLAAGWLRHGPRVGGAVGAGAIGGIFVGEAIYGLRELQFSSPAGYWHAQIAIGVVLWVGLTLWACRGRLRGSLPALALSLASGAVVGLATYVAYRV